MMVIDARGNGRIMPRAEMVSLLRAGDVLVANDAATLPASLSGRHLRSGADVEIRLAGWREPANPDVRHFIAVAFGAGDFHMPTEHRPPPPVILKGDRLQLGSLDATIGRLLGHWRLVEVNFAGPQAAIWQGLALHGRPIQYAHVSKPLSLWDVWSPIAGMPVAFEAPSASYLLDWETLERIGRHGATFATLTHAAGISSTGDDALDSQFPLDEPYFIPPLTARAIREAKSRGSRIVAVGTTVVRALEHASIAGGVRAGHGVANLRISPHYRPRTVDALITGVHEPGSSHFDLLGAFARRAVLTAASVDMDRQGFLCHEFGESLFVERGLERETTREFEHAMQAA